ncbi:SRCR-like domain-containing protein [Baffinella frigidus]|nr:SRCR-like domain-containing protein [Cryptophyta sp. CCMP2293]
MDVPQRRMDVPQLLASEAPEGAHRRVVAGVAVLLGAVALVLVATSQLAGAVGGVEMVGTSGGAAGQYGSISGMTHIFWGEQDGMPGRYPPEYAQQLKSMRTLIKQIEASNVHSTELIREERELLREYKYQMETLEENTVETLMEKVDKYKTDIAQIEPAAGPPGLDGKQGFRGKDGARGINGRGKPAAAGTDGMDGERGPRGLTGPLGRTGPQGTDLDACPGGVSPGAETRLVDCSTLGCRVEVQHNGVWGTVCDNAFTMSDAEVVCRSMGMTGGREKKRYGLYDWKEAVSHIPIWMSRVKCSGDEIMLEHCAHKDKDFVWGETHCEHDHDVAVCCVRF